ncbi:MAG: hypothetical protein ACLRWH_00470 [Emergencia sp.]
MKQNLRFNSMRICSRHIPYPLIKKCVPHFNTHAPQSWGQGLFATKAPIKEGGSTFCCRLLATYQQRQTELSTVGEAHLLAVDWLGCLAISLNHKHNRKEKMSFLPVDHLHQNNISFPVCASCPDVHKIHSCSLYR